MGHMLKGQRYKSDGIKLQRLKILLNFYAPHFLMHIESYIFEAGYRLIYYMPLDRVSLAINIC